MKYLFEAHLKDKTIISQTGEDLSKVDPSRSAYFDVVQRLSEVELFGLYNATDTYVVDLRTGEFEYNDKPYLVHALNPTNNSNNMTRELVYFRRVKVTKTPGIVEDAVSTEFHVGWNGFVDGKLVEQKMLVLD